MKKILLCIFTIVIFNINISNFEAKTITVKFSDCVDGDTAKFVYKDEVMTARFLAIDTPETKHSSKGEEPYGEEAAEYTCNALKKANKITLEFDDNADKDKYGRYLVWVFIDDKLLQKKLVSKGYASVTYLYDDYKYTDELKKAEQTAEDKNLGIWSINQTEDIELDDSNVNKDFEYYFHKYKDYIMLIGAIIIIFIFSRNARKSVKKEIETNLTKKVNKEIKKKLK